MTAWLAFLLGAFGLAYIVGHSTISLPLRYLLGGSKNAATGAHISGVFGPRGDLFVSALECPACFGFWTGFAAALFGVGEVAVQYAGFWPSVWLGCIVSGSNYALARLTRLME